jgi:hypothetical protein
VSIDSTINYRVQFSVAFSFPTFTVGIHLECRICFHGLENLAYMYAIGIYLGTIHEMWESALRVSQKSFWTEISLPNLPQHLLGLYGNTTVLSVIFDILTEVAV